MQMAIEPDEFYPADSPEPEPLGAPQTRNRHRHEGRGCPYYKVGNRVFYLGRDVLEYLGQCWIETEAGR